MAERSVICHTLAMPQHTIIDGNNLLYAMHAHAPLPHVGRETLVRIIDRWAQTGDDKVTLVFDGPTPREGLAKQMASDRIDVRFSAPETADDVIVSMIHAVKDPMAVRVVSSDTAIGREARYRRCRHTDAVGFTYELFAAEKTPTPHAPVRNEKPDKISPEERRQWLELFGLDDGEGEPLEGHGGMTGRSTEPT
jgi:hypothetical protein